MDVFAGFNRLSARATLARDRLATNGLANCISVFALGGASGNTAHLAHYDTSQCFVGDMQVDVTELQNFENWMRTLTAPSTYIVSLGTMWRNNAFADRLRVGIAQAFNAHVFDTCNSAIAYIGGDHTSWSPPNIPAWLTNGWDGGGRDAGTAIPYRNYFPQQGPGGCIIA